MAAYLLFIREGEVFNQDEMDAYRQANAGAAASFVEKYKMKPLVVYGRMEALEGEAPDGIVMLEFPTVEEARGWYNSPEYQAALVHRLKAANYRAVLVEGL
jgi:uncharacterized protein (DUF1330 family)